MLTQRGPGAAAALTDVFENAVLELKNLLSSLTQAELTAVVDAETEDPDCKSIQTVLRHVLRSGHCYIIYLRRQQGEDLPFWESDLLPDVTGYLAGLDDLVRSYHDFFKDYPDLQLEVLETEEKLKVRWGQVYDPEQLLEHAIVHVMRHHRQIERFLKQLRSDI